MVGTIEVKDTTIIIMDVDKINEKLNKLLGQKDAQERQANIETYYTGNGVGMRSKF